MTTQARPRAGRTGGAQHGLEVVAPVATAVAARELDRAHLGVLHERREPRERLPAAPAEAHQQRVAARLADDPADARHVLHGEREEDEAHGRFGVGVVLGKILRDRGGEGAGVRELHVAARFGGGREEVAKEERA